MFREFVSDVVANAGYQVLTLSLDDMELIFASARSFDLDFDDAYQHAIAEKYDLIIVSFDADFDKTTRGRKTPAELLA